MSADRTLATSAALLSPQARGRVTGALVHAGSVDHERTIFATIRAVLADEEPDCQAIGVVFPTMAFDEGYLLYEHGAVLFSDGATDDIWFDALRDVLAAEFGARTAQTTLAVDLRTGRMNLSDSGTDPASMRARFGLPTPDTE